MIVLEPSHWTTACAALIGAAAHGLSPHISAVGTLGIEDVGVLCDCLAGVADLGAARGDYERRRRERFDRVGKFSAEVESAADATEFAH